MKIYKLQNHFHILRILPYYEKVRNQRFGNWADKLSSDMSYCPKKWKIEITCSKVEKKNKKQKKNKNSPLLCQ